MKKVKFPKFCGVMITYKIQNAALRCGNRNCASLRTKFGCLHVPTTGTRDTADVISKKYCIFMLM